MKRPGRIGTKVDAKTGMHGPPATCKGTIIEIIDAERVKVNWNCGLHSDELITNLMVPRRGIERIKEDGTQ